ncbi:MAG: PilN domain-containing protein [Patescibacteria group bacterium]
MPQYSKNVAEQFLGPEKLPVGWPWRMFLFSVIVFALTLLIYFGMIFGYKPYLETERQSLDKKINEIGGAVSETDRENFIKFYSQLVNIQTLLNNHISGSNIYTFLEKNTNQGVYYEGASLSVPEHFLRLEGIARSYDNLVQQLVVFEQAPEIKKVILEESRTADKGVSFSIQVTFKPELLR